MNNKPPCKGCVERHIGCHAECERYAEWNGKHKDDLDKAHAEKAIRDEFRAHMDAYFDKMFKKANKKRFGQF